MSSLKCSQCGLINWAEDECCRRCKAQLLSSNDQKPPEVPEAPETNDLPIRMMQPVDEPSLYCLNGIGTRLLGWKHHPDGTATTTTWFTIFYAPIFPGSRYRLAAPTVDEEPRISLGQIAQAMLQIKRLDADYEFLEQLPLSGREVLNTYLFAYIWLPLMLFVPLAVILYLMPKHDPNDGSQTDGIIFGIATLVWFGYALFVMATLLHRSRGGVR